ncbi:hypothetical protein [Jeotgalibacillus proteolyticus]|uniref:hypothetical protein n=1 Tax=Jeotgalibacillus proteolyticus TaxID=2082395 RepID=UPI003CF43903
MKNSNRKESIKMASITLATSVLLLFTLLALQINGVSVYIGAPPVGISHNVISNLLIIVAIASFTHLFKDRVIKAVIIVLAIFFIGIPSLPNLLFEKEYTTFSSPDNQEEFVVVERGYGRLYQLSNLGLYMTYLTDIETDNGYKPFSNGSYKLEWEEPNRLTIQYRFDNISDSLSKDISINYKAK